MHTLIHMHLCVWCMEVEQQRQKDAGEGHKIALKLEGKINRKVSRYTWTT